MAAVLPQKPNDTYTFASQPRAVAQRKKYRESQQQNPRHCLCGEGPTQYGNIMYDRRVIRGNTYALHTLPASAQPDPIEIQRQQENRRRAIARKRAKDQLRPRSPDPVEGRKHIDVQTELYLEELSDRVEEADQECQTDAFLDRPPSPLFVPAKTGIDVATQIYEGDLFDFDIEVKPILEVLVGKTVEQALLEVMEEEELANLRQQQRAFEELRNAELVEQQRLEEQERRHREEKERRMKQQREILKKEKETAEKIAARAFAQSYLADLVPSVFGTLSDNGYFFDPVERDVEQGFLPWLMEQVTDEIDRSDLARMVLDGLLREVVVRRTETYKTLDDHLAAVRRAEEAARNPAPPEPYTAISQNSEHAATTAADEPPTRGFPRSLSKKKMSQKSVKSKSEQQSKQRYKSVASIKADVADEPLEAHDKPPTQENSTNLVNLDAENQDNLNSVEVDINDDAIADDPPSSPKPSSMKDDA